MCRNGERWCRSSFVEKNWCVETGCVEKLVCRNGLCWIGDVWNRFVVNRGLCSIATCCIEACAETPRVGSVAGVIHNSFVQDHACGVISPWRNYYIVCWIGCVGPNVCRIGLWRNGGLPFLQSPSSSRPQNMSRTVYWKLHILTAALQNYKFVENLWEIYVSLWAVYVTLQQPQKV